MTEYEKQNKPLIKFGNPAIKYKVFVNGGSVKAEQMYYSDSRDCRKHMEENDAKFCEIFDMYDRQVSSAYIDEEGKVKVKVFKRELLGKQSRWR